MRFFHPQNIPRVAVGCLSSTKWFSIVCIFPGCKSNWKFAQNHPKKFSQFFYTLKNNFYIKAMWKSTAFSSVFHAQTQTRNNNKEMELQTARFFFLWICARIAEEMKIQKKIEKNCRDSLVHSKKSRAKYWDVKKEAEFYLMRVGGWWGWGMFWKDFFCGCKIIDFFLCSEFWNVVKNLWVGNLLEIYVNIRFA